MYCFQHDECIYENFSTMHKTEKKYSELAEGRWYLVYMFYILYTCIWVFVVL